MPTNQTSRNYWLWVTRPEYYLDEFGNDREEFDPSSGVALDGWWSCHKETQRGDLVLVYRTTPKCDIAYFIQAESDAYPLADDEYAAEQGWEYGCDYRVFHKFDRPLSLRVLRDDPHFHEWPAYRRNFFGKAFSIPPDIWKKLNQHLASGDPVYQALLVRLEQESVLREIVLEEELEEALVTDLGLLEPHGFDLRLWTDPTTGVCGRQLVCTGNGGRIDLLCFDSRRKRYVVIEVKNVRAGQNALAQVMNYMGWVKDRIAGRAPLVGVVISRGFDVRFASSRSLVSDQIFHLNLADIGFE